MVTIQNYFLELFIIFNNSDILLASIIPIKIYSNSDLNKVSIIEDNRGKAGVYKWLNILTEEFKIDRFVKLPI
jgi:hypothetical protein